MGASFFKNDQIEGAEEVPVRDAATVMIVRDAPEFEVLLVQRASKLAFAANGSSGCASRKACSAASAPA